MNLGPVAMAPLYTASVPVFGRYLGRLAVLLRASETFDDGRQTAGTLLEARLAPDMLPFCVQVEIAANFSLRACFPLAGEAVPDYGNFPPTFSGLRARLARAETLISSLDPARFAGREYKEIQDQAGEKLLTLPAQEFLHLYALPNFFFHLATSYAILRKAGVPVGKGDFDGFHVYGLSAGVRSRKNPVQGG